MNSFFVSTLSLTFSFGLKSADRQTELEAIGLCSVTLNSNVRLFLLPIKSFSKKANLPAGVLFLGILKQVHLITANQFRVLSILKRRHCVGVCGCLSFNKVKEEINEDRLTGGLADSKADRDRHKGTVSGHLCLSTSPLSEFLNHREFLSV